MTPAFPFIVTASTVINCVPDSSCRCFQSVETSWAPQCLCPLLPRSLTHFLSPALTKMADMLTFKSLDRNSRVQLGLANTTAMIKTMRQRDELRGKKIKNKQKNCLFFNAHDEIYQLNWIKQIKQMRESLYPYAEGNEIWGRVPWLSHSSGSI